MRTLIAELKKTRRSRLAPVLLLMAATLWLPSAMNAELNFTMQAEGISPENSFFIQGFMGLAWFMYPAAGVTAAVMLVQTEKRHGGLVKMLSMPVGRAELCLAKFTVLAAYSALFMLLAVAGYYAAGAVASRVWDYPFLLPPRPVLVKAAEIWLSSLPMLAMFWLVAAVAGPAFSAGAGLALTVPSVLIINTQLRYCYPPAYPFLTVTAEYGRLAANVDMPSAGLRLLLVPAALITAVCLGLACAMFGRAERR